MYYPSRSRCYQIICGKSSLLCSLLVIEPSTNRFVSFYNGINNWNKHLGEVINLNLNEHTHPQSFH